MVGWASDVNILTVCGRSGRIKGQDEVLYSAPVHPGLSLYAQHPQTFWARMFSLISMTVDTLRKSAGRSPVSPTTPEEQVPGAHLRIDLTSPNTASKSFQLEKGADVGKGVGSFNDEKTKRIANLSKWCSTEGDFLLGSMSVLCSSQYASTHHGAQQGGGSPPVI
ncbi:hypothetical protein TNCV_382811 [Trichonephila clavipes]|nr:hypothetical protein TNCV_382811 [Trichonephila clavipes]